MLCVCRRRRNSIETEPLARVDQRSTHSKVVDYTDSALSTLVPCSSFSSILIFPFQFGSPLLTSIFDFA